MSNGRAFRRRLVLTQEIDDHAEHHAKERAVRRRLVATTGRCPCGAVLHLPSDPPPGSITLVGVEHEPGCPAAEEAGGRAS